jgi:phage tail-like protein
MSSGFIVNTHRYDPYKNYKFRVIMNGKVVLGVSKVSALKRTTEVVTHRSGGDNVSEHKSPGLTRYEPILMERGITHDRAFEEWANSLHQFAGDSNMDLVNYKRDLILEVMNEKGQVAFRYFLHDCWVSEYTAMPELDAGENVVAIEGIKIELEGWERDVETTEPDESV